MWGKNALHKARQCCDKGLKGVVDMMSATGSSVDRPKSTLLAPLINRQKSRLSFGGNEKRLCSFHLRSGRLQPVLRSSTIPDDMLTTFSISRKTQGFPELFPPSRYPDQYMDRLRLTVPSLRTPARRSPYPLNEEGMLSPWPAFSHFPS